MTEDASAAEEIAEHLPEIMRRLFGGGLIASSPAAGGQAWELTVPQLRTLSLVADEPGCTMGELAQHLGIGMSAATGLVDRLVQHGLVQRELDPKDRRLIRLHLTEAGARAQTECRGERIRQVSAALSALSAAQRRRIASALALLHHALVSAKRSSSAEGKS